MNRVPTKSGDVLTPVGLENLTTEEHEVVRRIGILDSAAVYGIIASIRSSTYLHHRRVAKVTFHVGEDLFKAEITSISPVARINLFVFALHTAGTTWKPLHVSGAPEAIRSTLFPTEVAESSIMDE
jgi:hypothetical protein